MPHVLVLIGRILFSAIFLAAAPRHCTAEAAQHAADLGVPLARLAVPVSGVLAIAGGLSALVLKQALSTAPGVRSSAPRDGRASC
jgi:uncharacterized membrane protein